MYLASGWAMLACVLLVNPFTTGWSLGLLGVALHEGGQRYAGDLQYVLPAELDILLLSLAAVVLRAPRKLGWYLSNSPLLNLGISLVCTAMMLSVNVLLPGRMLYLRIPAVLVLLFFLVNVFWLTVIREPGLPLSPRMKNLGISLLSLLLTLTLVEAVFMFVQRPHRYNGTLASRAWFMHHWQQNAEGYRDVPLEGRSRPGRKNILLVGDSFVAGHGLENPDDRFGNLLQMRVGPMGFDVYNLGLNGSDTRSALQRVRAYPVKPDILLYAWVPNDIEEAAKDAGVPFSPAKPYGSMPAPIRFFLERSCMLNYLWWRFPHPDESSDYQTFLKHSYQNPRSLMAHYNDLDSLRTQADSAGAHFMMLTFPFMEDSLGTAYAVKPVQQWCSMRQVPCVDVISLLKPLAVSSRMVNENDGHPSALVQRFVVEALYQRLKSLGWIWQM